MGRVSFSGRENANKSIQVIVFISPFLAGLFRRRKQRKKERAGREGKGREEKRRGRRRGKRRRIGFGLLASDSSTKTRLSPSQITLTEHATDSE